MSVINREAEAITWECDWCGEVYETSRPQWPATPPRYTICSPECGRMFQAWRLNPMWCEPQEPGDNRA